MEPAAFGRFIAIAAANGIRFRAMPYEGDVPVMVVDVDGVECQNDA
jgi:hypothetical protein